MVKSIAEKHGLRATFMPKPFINLTGNGCHVHLSVWDNDGKTNLFEDEKGELGVSKLGYHFLGGLMHHAAAMCAITNPTVNSYKRINAPRTISGPHGRRRPSPMAATTAPTWCAFPMRAVPNTACPTARRTRTCCWPPSSCRHAWGGKQIDPGKRLDIDMYAEGHTIKDAKKLPLNLLDALRNFEQDSYLQEMLGKEVSAGYLKLKHNEWNQYCRHLTQWERDTTLDC